MPSKMVITKLRSSRVVVQAARVHGPELAPRIAARLPEGSEAAAGVAPLFSALADLLEGTATAMDEADGAHEDELGDDDAPRLQRDESTETLVLALVDLRRTVELVYGAAAAKELGFSGETPREPTMVASFTARVLDRLPTLADRTPRMPGMTLDLPAIAAPIAAAHEQLHAALQTVAVEAREAEQTLLAKQAAIADYDAAFGSVARVLEGMFSLAGAKELARRVRPSVRRAGEVAELSEEGEGEEPPGSTEAVPEPTPEPGT